MEENSNLPDIEINKMFGCKLLIIPEVSADCAMPDRTVFQLELLLYEISCFLLSPVVISLISAFLITTFLSDIIRWRICTYILLESMSYRNVMKAIYHTSLGQLRC